MIVLFLLFINTVVKFNHVYITMNFNMVNENIKYIWKTISLFKPTTATINVVNIVEALHKGKTVFQSGFHNSNENID